MLKIGYIVRVKSDHFHGYENMKFKVMRSYMSDTLKCELFVVKQSPDGYERHFDLESLEKYEVYYRRKKIEKIIKRYAVTTL